MSIRQLHILFCDLGRFLRADLPWLVAIVFSGVLLTDVGCSREKPTTPINSETARHHHQPPHGGTPVVLGDEVYHLELIRDGTAGRLQAYVLDGEMENFVRIAATSFEIRVAAPGGKRQLTLNAVANPATGEVIGDTSLFEGQADWLKTTERFSGSVVAVTIRGSTFARVDFRFPEGNDP